MDVGAKRLGERLLGEVQVEGLTELFSSLRDLQASDSGGRQYFGIKQLDALLSPPPPPALAPLPQQQQIREEEEDLWDPDANPTISNSPHQYIQARPKRNEPPSHPPILELVSPTPTHHPSSAGKTSLIYHITTLAILPQTFLSAPLGGHNAAIVILDPLSRFSIPRLTQILTNHIVLALRSSNSPSNPLPTSLITTLVKNSLTHIHIFRPSTWTTLLATLRALPTYLFTHTRHHSWSRRIHTLVLEDLHVFMPVLRNSTPTTPLAGPLANDSNSNSNNNNPLPPASASLTHVLLSLATRLSAAVLLTSSSTSATHFRPPLPTGWPVGTQITRLAVKRVDVVRFAVGVGVLEAGAGREEREEIVKRGRFECFKVGVGVRRGEGEGFVFRVGGWGVEVEREGEGG